MRKPFAAVAAVVSMVGGIAAAQRPTPPDPLVRENATVKVSAHVYVIPDNNIGGVPNVGIVVGNRATLIIDTGMGPRNGQAILRETAKVSKKTALFLSATHFHPEHAGGAVAFPTATFIIPDAQAKELADQGQQMIDTFAKRNAIMGELLKGVTTRRPDVTFEREHLVDLGGVRVRMFVVGPTHTRGDTAFFVEGDNVLFSGDVVMKSFPAANSSSSIRAWVAALDRFEGLRPRTIVPAHGPMGDSSMMTAWRDYFREVQTRVAAMKAQGKSADEAANVLMTELPPKYGDWGPPARIANAARAAYAEAP
jgi:glyoxylase-like metal-dependent hydrolase (beta-lactamase superfamily II)